MQPTIKMLWTAAGNAAINEGASLMQGHIDCMPDASPLKHSVARLQAYNLKKILTIDVPPDDRMALQRNEKLRLVLLTSGLVTHQQSRNKACFHSLLRSQQTN